MAELRRKFYERLMVPVVGMVNRARLCIFCVIVPDRCGLHLLNTMVFSVRISDESFAGYRWLNAGIGGDGTAQVLWRCQNGILDGYQTPVIALLVGTNNRHDSAEDVARGIQRIVEVVRAKQPGAKILLSPILPRFAREDGGGWLSRVGESAFAVCHVYEILI